MGECYVRKLLNVERPRVAILSNGEESTKGTALTRDASALLRRSDLRFIGYVEGKDIFSGDVDLVVTDGFTGNVALKTAESLAQAISAILKRTLSMSPITRLGAWLSKDAFQALRQEIDYAEAEGMDKDLDRLTDRRDLSAYVRRRIVGLVDAHDALR